MDARRALPFLLLVICTINAAFSIHNGRGGPNRVRHVRRINEYLAPPPPPRFHSPDREPRVVNYQSNNQPGYFARLMNWLNPFRSPPTPPSLPRQPEIQYPTNVIPSASAYNGPPPVNYETQPIPSSFSNHLDHLAPDKIKNCNLCNKVPWVPVQQNELAHSEGASPQYASPFRPPLNGGYLEETLQDVHQAASQEVRVPDFSFVPQLPNKQGIFMSPLPNPQLYPGAMSPLFKADNFHSPQGIPGHAASQKIKVPDFAFAPPLPGEQDIFMNPMPYPQLYSGAIPPLFKAEVFYSPPVTRKTNSEYLYTSTSRNKTATRNDSPPKNSSAVVSHKSKYTNSDASVTELGKIEDISFAESSVLDFTFKDESSTHLSSIPSSSDVYADVRTTMAPNDETFGTQDIASTDYTIDTVAKESNINNYAAQNIPPYTVSNDFLTPIDTAGESTENILLEPYDIPDETNDDTNVSLDVTSEDGGGRRNKKVQLIIPYTLQHTPLPFQPLYDSKINFDANESNHDKYVGQESNTRYEVVRAPNSILSQLRENTKKSVYVGTNNSIDGNKLQKNIDNWTIEKYLSTTSTVSPGPKYAYLSPYSKTIPKEYFIPTKSTTGSYDSNVKTSTVAGFSYNNEKYKKLDNHRMEEPRVQKMQIENSTKSPIVASTTSKEDMWQNFPRGISSVSKEVVYIVTPQPPTTPSSNHENRRQQMLEKAESNMMESKETSQTDMKETKDTSDTFESIEKAYQVLPQAVNNLAVASTGPESVSLWSIEDFASSANSGDNEYDDNDTEPPVQYSTISKESRARR